jgi:hypothetical protein
LVVAEGFYLPAFLSGAFLNSHYLLDTHVKISYGDLLFLLEADLRGLAYYLFCAVFNDHYSSIANSDLLLNFLFFTDYQDFFTLVLYHSPELILALSDLISLYWGLASLLPNPAAFSDTFSENTLSLLLDVLDYFILFICFFWLTLLSIGSFRLTT